MMHKAKMECFINYAAAQREATNPLLPWVGLDPELFEGEDRWIAQWLSDNLFKLRPHKTPQLFIYGDTNLGKTHLWLQLMQYCRIYILPNDDKWYDGYNDKDYDLVILDEFHGNKTIHFMNQFLEGIWMPLPQRGNIPYIKKNNVPVIIFSNHSLDACYKNKQGAALQALEGRLLICHVETQIKVL